MLMSDDDDLFTAWAQALTERGMFGRVGQKKGVVERATVQEFAKSCAAKCDRGISDIQSSPDDPPDVLAHNGRHHVGIELVELAVEKVRRRDPKGLGYAGKFQDQQWSKRTFQAMINYLLDKKQDRCALKPIVVDAVLICSDEPWLLPHNVEQWLAEAVFTSRPNIRSAYLMLSCDPAHDHWPVFAIYGDLWA